MEFLNKTLHFKKSLISITSMFTGQQELMVGAEVMILPQLGQVVRGDISNVWESSSATIQSA